MKKPSRCPSVGENPCRNNPRCELQAGHRGYHWAGNFAWTDLGEVPKQMPKPKR
jgi:hypothetical protein